MESRKSDPLLDAAKVLVVLIEIIIVFLITMIGIGIGALLTVGRGEVLEKIAQAGAPDAAYPLLILAFALVGVLLMLAHRFFQQLRGIVTSVRDGDPFQRDNADRLTRMGWLSVAGHALTLVLIALAGWFAPFLDKIGEGSTRFGFDVEPTGILLTLILFILARVFRLGAAMREDLEGTV